MALSLPGLMPVSRANRREHWTARNRRDKREAEAVRLAWHGAWLIDWRPPLPITVVMTRVGTGRAMDSDNLHGAFKAVRDALSHLLRIDDGDERVRWRVRQKPGLDALVLLSIAPRRR